MGRPVTDTPKSDDPLFLIEFPDPAFKCGWRLFCASSDINTHQKMIDGLIENGHRDFRERKVRAGES